MPEPTKPKSSLEEIYNIVGNDIVEIFGDTGTCKSKFVHAIALEAIKNKYSVFFLDTERNLSNKDIESLGKSYKYTPIFSEISKTVTELNSLATKPQLVIIDSVGLPILTQFAKMDMKKKGDALLSLIALMGDLKEYAFRNNAMVIVTNQPESEFNKSPGTERQPFGDKSCFVVKEIWKTKKTDSKPDSTKAIVESFRSRNMGKGIKLFNIEITDKGTEVSK